MAGLQGSGKTTNSAKLARWFKAQGRNPLLVGADLQRPAAVQQLRTLAEQVGVPVYSADDEIVAGGQGDPVDVAKACIDEARRLGKDVVIVDTAGRLAIDAELMEQVGAPVYSAADEIVAGGQGDPVAVAKACIAEARRLGKDVVIVDTAGRLAIDAELMEQVRQISEATAPDYTFLVVDAMTGQDA